MSLPAAAPPDPPQTIRLLVVEDSQVDYELLLATLARERLDVVAQRIEERHELIRALAEARWDAVISDHHLPRFSSTEALQVVRASGLILPFIIVSGLIGEETAVAAMREGADDFLVKGRLARLGPALLNALAAAEARRERLRTARELEQSELRLRELLAHLETVIDEERRAIAREIHDDVGGLLTALRFDLSWIERSGEERSAERARYAKQTLTQAMQAAQRIQRNLRPPVLDAGLLEALHWQIEDFRRRTGVAVAFSSNVDTLALGTVTAMTVYRTLQEALTNVTKHAQASSVRVGLVVGANELSLEIADDGVGLRSSDLDKPASFGLRGLAERAARAGGWLDVSPGARGTCVLLSLPVRADPAPSDSRPSDGATR
ncbi:MAG: response regulator [Burkholderiaceae bacterium]|nr:response regulator [Burkholderiaceae bacterium]HMN63450.1 histidine kinase [Burkholderiaceae bacterium]